MTPTQQSGYDAQRRGEVDPDMARADTPAGREYRDGVRMRRRDEADAIMRDGAEFARDRLGPGWTPTYENPDNAHGEQPAEPITEQKGTSAAITEEMGRGIKSPNAFADPEPGAKKHRKAKPADEGQGSLFA